MIFTEEQSEIILTNEKNLVNRFSRNESTSRIETIKNYGTHTKALTTEERVLIGTVARAGLGTTGELAKEFGVHRNHVTNLREGRVTFASNPNFKSHPELEEKILGKLNVVEERAIDLLMRSIGVITDEKLEKTNAKDASTIALNASRIVQNCQPQVQNDNKVNVIMYAPKLKTIEDFKVVEI